MTEFTVWSPHEHTATKNTLSPKQIITLWLKNSKMKFLTLSKQNCNSSEGFLCILQLLFSPLPPTSLVNLLFLHLYLTYIKMFQTRFEVRLSNRYLPFHICILLEATLFSGRECNHKLSSFNRSKTFVLQSWWNNYLCILHSFALLSIRKLTGNKNIMKNREVFWV